MTLRYVHGAQYAIDPSGEMIPGSKLYFYLAGTSQATPQDVFSDSARVTPISQPVLADASGRWPDIFMDDEIYDVVWKDASGTTIDTFLNVDAGLSSALGTGTALAVNQGGTGSKTAAAALTALGAASQSQFTTLSNSVATNTAEIATGLNVGDPTRFGTIAKLDTIATTNLVTGFGAIDLQIPVFLSTNANTSISSTIPIDSSIPQVGEGTEILSQSFTPVSTTSKIVIDVCAQGGAASNASVAAALFRAGAANAVSAGGKAFGNNDSAQIILHYEESSGALTPVIWSVRVGGTFTLNGNVGASTLGQKSISWIRIREVKAF